MVNAVDYLVAEGLICRVRNTVGSWLQRSRRLRSAVPDSIKQMIEKQVDHLDADGPTNT